MGKGNTDAWYNERWNKEGSFNIIQLFKERMYSLDKGNDVVLKEFMKAIKWMFAGGDKDSDFVRNNILKARNPFISFVNNYQAFVIDNKNNHKEPTCYDPEEIKAAMARNHDKYMKEHYDLIDGEFVPKEGVSFE